MFLSPVDLLSDTNEEGGTLSGLIDLLEDSYFKASEKALLLF